MSEARGAEGARAAIARAIAIEPITGKVAREALIAGLGGTVAIGLLAGCASISAMPLIIAPFGASSVLLFAAPASPLAQPRNVVGGHLLSTFVGLVMLTLLGPSAVTMAIAVGVAITIMRLTGTLHPPAGADPIVVVAAGASWWFLAAPVAAGAVILVVCAVIYHRFVSGQAYPKAA